MTTRSYSSTLPLPQLVHCASEDSFRRSAIVFAPSDRAQVDRVLHLPPRMFVFRIVSRKLEAYECLLKEII